ncbi:MAG: hypothetical protein RIE59_23500 [Imperialibacter sp.]
MSQKINPSIIKTDPKQASKLGPSVIGAGGNMQEEVVKKEQLKPSVIAVSQPGETAPVAPSAIKAGDVNKPAPDAEQQKVVPSKMAGMARKRLPVTIEDVKKAHPGQKEEILEMAYQFVLEIDIQEVVKSSVLLWKTDLQKRYSEKVMELLDCTQNEAIAKTGSQISRVIEILEAIDLRGVCDYGQDGVFAKLIKGANKEFDTPEELLQAEKELKQLTQRLAVQLKALIQLQHNLQTLNAEVLVLSQSIRASGIAASFLSDYLRRKSAELPKIADQFHERSMSLMQTEAQIFENEMAREMQMEHPIKLISTIQNTVLVMIPDWLGSVGAIRSMLESNKKVTVTHVEEISDWKKKIIKLLN